MKTRNVSEVDLESLQQLIDDMPDDVLLSIMADLGVSDADGGMEDAEDGEK